RDPTGRAQRITLEGEHRRELSGWEFKLIVGRTLGWNFIESTRFEITQQGATYIFRGTGFGHGLGLCQEGAHVMARRGMDYKQILSFYFPTTRAGPSPDLRNGLYNPGTGNFAGGVDSALLVPVLWRSETPRSSLSSENFSVSYPREDSKSNIEALLKVLESARNSMLPKIQ